MSFSFSRVVDVQHMTNLKHAPWFSRAILIIGVVLSVVGGVLLLKSSTTKPTEEERIIQACPTQERQATSSGMLVYVSGGVKNPGVYTLHQETNRVYEAIEQAGGFSEGADKAYISKTLNMVGRLKDGERVYVPMEAESQQIQSSLQSAETTQRVLQNESQIEAQNKGMLNPNTATQQQLEQLPGIGAVRAQQVIQGRPYSDMNDFRARSGLSQTVINSIELQLLFSTD